MDPQSGNPFDSSNGHRQSFNGPEEDDELDSMLKYIRQVLLEEEDCIFYDPLVIQSAEKPFFDALGNDLSLSPDQHPLASNQFGDSPDDTVPGLLVESIVQRSSFDIFSDRESMMLFQKGVEEASKFLPKSSNLVIDLESMTRPVQPEGDRVVGKSRRVRYLDDGYLEDGRSSKMSAVSLEEAEDLSEMLDRVLLYCPHKKDGNDPDTTLMQEGRLSGGDPDGKGLPKRRDGSENVVDLRSMLVQCAQAVASGDRRSAREMLGRIRRHSSPQGDGCQRLAHYFGNALEARLEGTGSLKYAELCSKRSTAAQRLKSHQFSLSFCPFMKMSIMFSNFNIMKAVEDRKKLHVIDFGIYYGFQWPVLIQLLSQRPGGPPALRITGIELPQPGFRPAQTVEETGRLLSKYCKRFGVPFEFVPIVQKWETVKLEDVKLEDDEFVVVNSLFRFKNLLDETAVADSQRDAVLSLIRRIKPGLFVHAIANGLFNSPFFSTRFREALFHYSTLFDMLDTTTSVPRGDIARSMFEEECIGREIMNVVACEGAERVERPETYKQWQAISTKAGFRQLPLDPWIVEKGRHKISFFHKDYALNIDGNWALMGWKGRVLFALSAWVPS